MVAVPDTAEVQGADMRRNSTGIVRPNWRETIASEGLVYNFTGEGGDGSPDYWREGPYFELTPREIELLEEAAQAVFSMCDEAGDWLCEHPEMMLRMGIPVWAHQAIIDSWWRQGKNKEWYGSVYGRFDVAFGGLDHHDPPYRIPRFYEFNADTPTCVIESSQCQWTWHEQTQQGNDQWNGLFEALVAAWKRNLQHIETALGHKPMVYFACSNDEPSGEDEMNLVHLQDACDKAGYATRRIYIEDVGLGNDGRFYDNSKAYENEPVHLEVIFKLYPWEYMLEQEFGQAAFKDMANIEGVDGSYAGGTFWIEPPYKLLWSNKALFAVLWQLFGDDPRGRYLLPTYFEGEQPESMTDYVRKPFLGREGANVEIFRNGEQMLSIPGHYDTSSCVVQAFHPLPAFYHGSEETPLHPMCGIWMADGEPVALGIRECEGLVTDNSSFFIPHVIRWSVNA